MEEKAKEVTESSPGQKLETSSRRILVVEGEPFLSLFVLPSTLSSHSKTDCLFVFTDNLVNQRVLLRQLTMAGYLCDVANNGQEAVEQYESGSYDLIFMDVV